MHTIFVRAKIASFLSVNLMSRLSQFLAKEAVIEKTRALQDNTRDTVRCI